MSLIVFALGAVVAAVGTGVVTARSARASRLYLVLSAMALFGLAVGLGAATLGDLSQYSGLIFRAMELGAQVLAPLLLSLVLVEIAGRGVPARFAMRLAVSAIFAVAVVVASTDPLQTMTFTNAWPDPALLYNLVPLALIGFIAVFTFVTAMVTLIVALSRSSRDRASRDAVRPLVAASVAAMAVVLPGLSWTAAKAGFALPLPAKDGFAIGCLLAAGLTWSAATMAERLGVVAPGPGARSDRHGDTDWRDDTGAYPGYETGEFGDIRSDDRGRGQYGGFDPGHDRRADFGDDPDYDLGRARAAGNRYGDPDAELHYPALAALAADPAEQPPDAGYGEPGRPGQFDRHPEPVRPGELDRYPEPGKPGALADRGDYRSPRAAESPAQLFGQIAIYTLIEERVDDFDRLTERVVAKVRSNEPDTLVYIVHAVPTAPMQRILYEVYRDRAAHDEHLRQPYVRRYESERRPFVLATNVIELGLQQAKVSPLPSYSAISDILSESGIDLTGVTRSPRPSAPPPPNASRPRSAPYEPPPGEPSRPGTSAADFDGPGYGRPHRGGGSGWADIRGEEPRYQ
ncbi:MAG TPA: antibiotic biosynthesis monooxygenase [Streptosporangiaceae bacterium]|nr:antibiotic biosynthesis monooxygenase [Streptosporangiaceae bacterium]